MSKITNDRLTQSVTGYFIAVPIWQQWASKGFWDRRSWQVALPLICLFRSARIRILPDVKCFRMRCGSAVIWSHRRLSMSTRSVTQCQLCHPVSHLSRC